MNSLYSRENMLDHLKNPRNKGKIKNPDLTLKVVNRHCGDILYLYAKVKDGKITKLTFDGDGCDVSMSSSSMVMEELQSAKVSDLSKISKEQVLENFGQDLTPSRQSCALLVFDGIQQLAAELQKKDYK